MRVYFKTLSKPIAFTSDIILPENIMSLTDQHQSFSFLLSSTFIQNITCYLQIKLIFMHHKFVPKNYQVYL